MNKLSKLATESPNEVVPFAKSIIPLLGFTYNDKCEWSPELWAKFLGFIVDMDKFQFRVPQEKITQMQKKVSQVLSSARQNERITVREAQSLVGLLISRRPALLPAQVWSRYINADIARAANNKQFFMTFTEDAKAELEYWQTNLISVNGAPIWDPIHSVSLTVDAGAIGYGGHTDKNKHSGPLPNDIVSKSSTHRELFGLIHTAQALKEEIIGHHVLVRMDSFAAIRNLQKGGGPVAPLVDLIKEWSKWCTENRVTCTYKWISREENTEADRLSKALDVQWGLSRSAREIIERKWGPVTGQESKSTPNATAVAVPLFNEISNTIHSILHHNSRMILVHPVWEGQPWWPLMRKAAQAIDLPPASDSLRSDRGNITALERSGWRMRASLFTPLL